MIKLPTPLFHSSIGSRLIIHGYLPDCGQIADCSANFYKIESFTYITEIKMYKKIVQNFILLVCMLALVACMPTPPSPTPETNLPNPASVYCEENGGKLDIREDITGGEMGICVFPDGSECEEWAYYRGECQPTTATSTAEPTLVPVIVPSAIPVEEMAEDGCRIYRNAELGYSFHYPAEARVEKNDDPLGGISVIGPVTEGESWPFYSVNHPQDREEYRLPADVDLLAWLTDHGMLGEIRAADAQIAGTTAIHFRHDRSPQSYAFDRYYFAKSGQIYMLLIGHPADKEDWTLYNHFLESFKFD